MTCESYHKWQQNYCRYWEGFPHFYKVEGTFLKGSKSPITLAFGIADFSEGWRLSHLIMWGSWPFLILHLKHPHKGSVVSLLWAGEDFEISLSFSLFLLNFFIEEVNMEIYFLANVNCLLNTQRLKGQSGYYYFIVLNNIFFHYGMSCILIDILRNWKGSIWDCWPDSLFVFSSHFSSIALWNGKQ